tara:strand:- start:8 stop:241 length:234 start_codon:yes stop_codon:yes gene_type:complete
MAEIIKAYQKLNTLQFREDRKGSYDKKYYSDIWDVLDKINQCKGGLNMYSEIINRYDYEIEISINYIKKDWTKEDQE